MRAVLKKKFDTAKKKKFFGSFFQKRTACLLRGNPPRCSQQECAIPHDNIEVLTTIGHLTKAEPREQAVSRKETPMLLHASCGAKDGAAVLLTGPPGAGKSDLLLRLIDRGFTLVADDQVQLQDGLASPPAALAGLIEIRGLGIIRLPFASGIAVAMVVCLERAERLPMPSRYVDLDLPMVSVDPWTASAPMIVEWALDGALGRVSFVAGAFA